MENYLPVLEKSGLFAGLSAKEIQEALEKMEEKVREYQKDEYILRAGDSVQQLGVVLYGSVLIIQEDFWGGRHVLAKGEKSQCFAEAFACVPAAPLNVSVVAQESCGILFLNVQQMLENANPVILRNLLADLAGKNLAFSEKLGHLSQRTTRAKLLSYLSAQAQRQGSGCFRIPFSRQQLADYLLVERSGLSAELSKMRREGLIQFYKNHFKLM